MSERIPAASAASRERPSRAKVLKSWGQSFLLAFLIVAPFRSAVADWNVVPSGSMKPTIVEGDRIFVNRLAYDLKVPFTTVHLAEWDGPARGDVVVCLSPRDGLRLVKRVAGVPGDRIALRDNVLWVNGEAADYAPLEAAMREAVPIEYQVGRTFLRESVEGRSHPLLLDPRRRGGPRTFGPITVPAGSYLMLGDNRDDSSDSRSFGFVPRDQVLGRAVGIFYSFDPEGWFSPRWRRFFAPLE